jgi:sporulation protein YlmC with PRC-barrel domain
MSSKRASGALLAVLGLALAAGSGLRAADKSEGIDVLLKASVLRGLPVTNSKGQDLGKVDDVVLNKDGTINYLAVSYGGALGVGNKLFAIPYKATTVQDNYKNKAGNFAVFLEADKMHFDAGPGFNKDAWPTEPDMGFFKAAGKEIPAAKEAVREAVRDAKGAATGDKKEIYRTSKVIGTTVKNPKGDSLGKINDLMIHTRGGKVVYAALSHGGVGGVGDKLFAIDWNAFQFQPLTGKPGEMEMVLQAEKAYFDTNPGFDQGKAWPSEPDKNFRKPPEAERK